jgi:hypothetical protein
MTVAPFSVTVSVAVWEVIEAFPDGYWCARTRANYAFILNGCFSWCAATATVRPVTSIPAFWRRGPPAAGARVRGPTPSPGGSPRCRRSTGGVCASTARYGRRATRALSRRGRRSRSPRTLGADVWATGKAA